MAVKTAKPVELNFEDGEGYSSSKAGVTRIPLSYVHLHAPLFFGSINFGEKIKAHGKGNLSITHYVDKEAGRNELHFTDPKGTAAYLPFVGNVACAIPVNATEADIKVVVRPDSAIKNPAVKGKVQAQVQAPAGIIIGR